MRLLLDSHVIVWTLLYPGRLRATTRAAIIDPSNEVFFSAASIWELSLKIAQKRLLLPDDYVEQLAANSMDGLPVTVAHARASATLPPLHGDPFDRLLIAQALHQGLVLVTSDRAIHRYDVPVLEA